MKRLIIIWLLHFIAVSICIVGATIENATAIQTTLNELSTLGIFFQTSAKLLAEPASSLFLQNIAKGSMLFWPILVLNSLLWASLIILVRRKLEQRNT